MSLRASVYRCDSAALVTALSNNDLVQRWLDQQFEDSNEELVELLGLDFDFRRRG